MNPPSPVLILGAGPLALTVRQRLTECGNYDLKGFIQTLDPLNPVPEINGLSVYHTVELENSIPRDWRIVTAIGSTRRKTAVETLRLLGFTFESVIHPTIFRDASMRTGQGCLALPGSTFSSFLSFGDGVVTTNSVNLGHHVEVGDFSTIAQGAIVGGSACLGRQVFVGMAAAILDHLTIGDGAIVAAGAVVTKDVPPRTMVAGVPARVIRENVDPL
jgi:sugar O-acyltransferase (sialic acid O-acetyltransferase NeuD family)